MRALAGRYHSSSLPSSTPTTTYYGPLLDQTNVPATPLSSGGNLIVAYSLRKMSTTYAGGCLVVQRDNDNATQLIGFNSDGTWNTALIASFCGTAAGFIRQVKDQSGNGYDWTARSTSTTSGMYRCWTGTAMDMVGTTACFKAVNTNSDLVSSAFAAQTNNQFTCAMVASIENTTTTLDGRMLSLYGSSNTDSSDAVGLTLRRAGSSTPSANWNLQRNLGSGGPSVTSASSYSTITQVMFTVSDPTYTVYLEGVAGTPVTNTQGNFNYTNISIGWTGNAHSSVGEYFEVVCWNTALTTTQLAAVNANQAGYWKTSSASSNPSGGTPTGSGSGGTNLPGWTLVMDEGFDTPCSEGQFLSKYPNFAAYANGTADTWAQAHGGGSQYRTDNISVANSTMYVRVYANSSGSYGAAILPIWPGKSAYQGYTYWRRDIRARCLNPVAWQKIADLFWPDSNVWNDGEIDFPEGNLNGTVGGFNHWPGSPSSQDSYSSSFTFTTWHTYTIENRKLDEVVCRWEFGKDPDQSSGYRAHALGDTDRAGTKFDTSSGRRPELQL